MTTTKVPMLCTHNSTSSQMGEAFLKKLAGDRFDVESAGLEKGFEDFFSERFLWG